MAQNTPTIASILQTLSMYYNGPVSEREVMDRVLEQRPSRAKDPYAAIREKLRWYGPMLGWVRLGGGTLLPLRLTLENLRFRCIPTEQEVRNGYVLLERFMPFIRSPEDLEYLEDNYGTAIPVSFMHNDAARSEFSIRMLHPRLDLQEWYQAEQFQVGDSILCTIRSAEPIALQLEREPAQAFKAHLTEAQDNELVTAIWTKLRQTHFAPQHSADIILPIYARASWRTSYPGRPWQELAANDERLRVIDNTYIDFSRTEYQPDNNFDQSVNNSAALDKQKALLQEIEELQAQMQLSRDQDVKAGLWSGMPSPKMLPDISAGSDEFDISYDAMFEQTFDPDASEERNEGFDEDAWRAFLDGDDNFDFGDDEDPDLMDASKRLLAALSPEEIDRLQHASAEEVNLLIASKLNYLLVHEPSLFVTIAKPGMQTNFQAPVYNDTVVVDFPYEDSGIELAEDDDDWYEEETWLGEPDEEQNDEDIEPYLVRSEELIHEFYNYLHNSGKSEQTARKRAGDLWVYAEFLSRNYARSLDEGDYGTLDECLFYFYPLTVTPRSPEAVKSICTSIRQFFAFLKHYGFIKDDAFAHALWRRRDQAAKVVALYQHICNDWTNTEELTKRLFAPYSGY
jgi:Site-specific recombinase XerD